MDDINSTIEFVQQQILQIPDDSPEDEDDDNGLHVNAINSGLEIYELHFQLINFRNFEIDKLNHYFDLSKEELLLGTFDIPLPPPKA